MSYTHVIRKSEPTFEPVQLEQVKDQLRIEDDFTEDDILLSQLITVARIKCEEYTNRYFAPLSVLYIFPSAQNVYLPPDSTITKVTVRGQEITDFEHDEDLNTVTFSSNYTNIKILLESGKSYPEVERAICMYVADWYENRTSDTQTENKAAQALLNPLRFNLGV